ncbi:MAG: glycerol-3-phosphate dehydrogenase [Pyrinomonadaceae bacterium]|nr:glycerol-3-phosphate dehydrogenase [Pyrinomonadaceae bacterium]
MTRQIPTDIQNSSFDAIIIGAGINGAGVARDAAMRGLKVLLLDKGDIASGTTSWSTRLIHGGLRYLEHGELGLVRESLRERERLFHIAPHLVKPLPLIVPVYARSKRGLLSIRTGMAAYDILSFDKSLAHHRMLSREETLQRVPGLAAEELRGAARYYDAQAEYPERLAVENCLSAVSHNAVVLNYARADRIIVEGNKVGGVEFTDLPGDDVYTVRAPVVVNVTGPWVDRLLTNLDRPPQQMIGGTKGSHLIVDRFPGAPTDALYVEAEEDGRPFFIIPWNNLYLIGTTDIRYTGDLDHVEADEREIDYLIRETNRVIPDAHLTRDSVLYTYSGVRPLPFLGVRTEGGITRRHFIHDHAPSFDGLLSIVGGKLTTYRNLAEQTVNIIFKKLNRKQARCMTAQVPLPGAVTEDFARFSESFIAGSILPEARSQRLLRIYGTRAQEVLKIAREDPELLETFSPETGAIGAEVVMSFRGEMAQSLSDCLLRRTMVGMNRAVGLDADEAAARIAQKYLGWSDAKAEQEVAAYHTHIERFKPETLAHI